MQGGSKMPLQQMRKLNSINGDKSEGNKRIQSVDKPIKERDVVTKEYADATYAPA